MYNDVYQKTACLRTELWRAKTQKVRKGSLTEGTEKRQYHFLMNNKYKADGCCCLKWLAGISFRGNK